MSDFRSDWWIVYTYECIRIIGIGIGFGIGIDFEDGHPISIPIPIAIPAPNIFSCGILPILPPHLASPTRGEEDKEKGLSLHYVTDLKDVG